MTTTTPVNPRGSAVARLVVNFSEFDDRQQLPAGVFEFYSDHDGPEAGILFGCPCGCGEMRSAAIRSASPQWPSWKWDGHREKPTLTPSILIYQMDEKGARIGEHWHGFLTAGEWRSC